MAKFRIKSINYIVSGKTSRLIGLSLMPQTTSTAADDSIRDVQPYTAVKYDNKRNQNTAAGENNFAVQIFQSNAEIDAWKEAESNKLLDNKTFMLGTSKDMKYMKADDTGNLYECNNVFSLYSKDGSIIVHPLFDIEDLCYKSYVQKYLDIDSNTDLSKQYVDVYAPQLSSGALTCTQLSGSIFMLTDKVGRTLGMHKAQDTINAVDAAEIEDIDYTFQISEDPLSTITYYGLSTNGNVSSIFDPGSTFFGLPYNCIIEFPASFSKYNDFKNGNAFGNTLYCKNYYNSLYSTEMPNSNTLDKCREYVDAFTCGSRVYLKYYDSDKYQAQSMENNVGTLQKINGAQYQFQKIESIDMNAMYCNNIQHKSNVYSIDINETGLETLDYNDKLKKLKDDIMQDIKNNIRLIAEKISPANTQLFDVHIVS